MIFTEENKNTITYDENWQSVSEPEYPVFTEDIEDENEEEIKPKKEKTARIGHGQTLVAVQLIVCVFIALAALIVKNIGGDLYERVGGTYYDLLNNSAVFDQKNLYDLNSLFGKSTQDEAHSSQNKN